MGLGKFKMKKDLAHAIMINGMLEMLYESKTIVNSKFIIVHNERNYDAVFEGEDGTLVLYKSDIMFKIEKISISENSARIVWKGV